MSRSGERYERAISEIRKAQKENGFDDAWFFCERLDVLEYWMQTSEAWHILRTFTSSADAMKDAKNIDEARTLYQYAEHEAQMFRDCPLQEDIEDWMYSPFYGIDDETYRFSQKAREIMELAEEEMARWTA